MAASLSRQKRPVFNIKANVPFLLSTQNVTAKLKPVTLHFKVILNASAADTQTLVAKLGK